MKIIAYCDGSSHRNPGPAGAGVWLWCEENHGLVQISWPLGLKTNNEAEYAAIVLALQTAHALGATEVEIKSDSEVLVNQILGEYQVQTPRLRPWHSRVRRLMEHMKVNIEWVPRSQNEKADELAGQASGSNPNYDELKRGRRQSACARKRRRTSHGPHQAATSRRP